MLGLIGRILPLFALVLVAGCANSNSIFRLKSLSGSDSKVVIVDAKQRAILSNPPDSSHTKYRVFCSEPSPDVFSVLSQSLSANASANVDSTGKTVAAALQGAFSNSEVGSTISRTQTLNMLREMMFRTCERYLSGAIDDSEFPIVAARDQRIIVSILAIEQLTGAVAPKPVVIGSTGNASTGLDATAAMKLLAKAKDDLDAADAEIVKAQAKMDKADGDAGAGKCAALASSVTPDATKKKACDDASKAIADAKILRDKQESYYNSQAKGLANNMGVSSAATTASGSVDDKDWTLAQADAVATVATTVETIVRETFEQDETQYFCFRMIATSQLQTDIQRNIGSDGSTSIADRCVGYLMTMIDSAARAEATKVGLQPQQYRSAFTAGLRSNERKSRLLQSLQTCFRDTTRSLKLDQSLQANFPSLLQILKSQNGYTEGQLLAEVDNLGTSGQRSLEIEIDLVCR